MLTHGIASLAEVLSVSGVEVVGSTLSLAASPTSSVSILSSFFTSTGDLGVSGIGSAAFFIFCFTHY